MKLNICISRKYLFIKQFFLNKGEGILAGSGLEGQHISTFILNAYKATEKIKVRCRFNHILLDLTNIKTLKLKKTKLD